jgi:hypothetical protein
MTRSAPTPTPPAMEINMYGYPYPPMIYPPPQNTPNIDVKYIEQGIKIAERLASRDQREKERAERMKQKKKDEDQKQAIAARARTLTALEWFIFGIISYPFVGPLYNMGLHYIQTVAK